MRTNWPTKASDLIRHLVNLIAENGDVEIDSRFTYCDEDGVLQMIDTDLSFSCVPGPDGKDVILAHQYAIGTRWKLISDASKEEFTSASSHDTNDISEF
uniref:Uncharacterized protein n=1 Tax=Ochrobactrum phage ORM_20 TaxID=2985243 RepID=A0A9N6ZG31_9VIRU|nr:hypothetical protein ORM20_00184 [Ochrobactrum phage ORM_20]